VFVVVLVLCVEVFRLDAASGHIVYCPFNAEIPIEGLLSVRRCRHFCASPILLWTSDRESASQFRRNAEFESGEMVVVTA